MLSGLLLFITPYPPIYRPSLSTLYSPHAVLRPTATATASLCAERYLDHDTTSLGRVRRVQRTAGGLDQDAERAWGGGGSLLQPPLHPPGALCFDLIRGFGGVPPPTRGASGV